MRATLIISLALSTIILPANLLTIEIKTKKSVENFNEYLLDKEFSFKNEILTLIEDMQRKLHKKKKKTPQMNICLWKICSRPLKNYNSVSNKMLIREKPRKLKLNTKNILFKVFHKF